MARLRINGVETEIPAGATLLDAAQQAGYDIPTLCHLKKTGALATCMICMVHDVAADRMVPACSTPVADGMNIVTESEEVRTSRREILRLLLNEHAGDCEGPCTQVCPASLNVPRMLRFAASGDLESAARLARRELVFPALLGQVCTAPCERGCRRSVYDASVSIRRSHGWIAEQFPALRIDPGAPSGRRVAVVGAGLAGLAAAWVCRLQGHACTVYEKAHTPCPNIRDDAPVDLLDREIASIRQTGVELTLNCEVGQAVPLSRLVADADAVIVACSLPHEPDNRIFAAHENKMAVRAIAHGKEAAWRVDAFLRDTVFQHVFNAQLGRLRDEEKDDYAVERLWTPPCDEDFSVAREAERCLHCDCLKPVSCKLRQYAQEYGLAPRLHRSMTRPAIAPIQCAEDVRYEPGKCIKCGICVELTRHAGIRPGLAFEGRGLDSRVCVPFGEPLVSGLGSVACECVESCPTGALAYKHKEETS